MSRISVHILVLVLLLAGAFTLAAWLAPQAQELAATGGQQSVLTLLLGEGRKVLANQFFTEADVTFHSGYYPSIFDQLPEEKNHSYMTSKEGSAADEEHDRRMNFLKAPPSWDIIAQFGRHFMITEHTHLSGGSQREILPWLRLSADLDPQKIETYTVGAYFLRVELKKPDQAEKFLREGLRANPGSYEILFELGNVYMESYHELPRARKLWELALRQWDLHELQKPEADRDLGAKRNITENLADLERKAGNPAKAIEYFEMAKPLSPVPSRLQDQINELRNQMNSKAQPSNAR